MKFCKEHIILKTIQYKLFWFFLSVMGSLKTTELFIKMELVMLHN